MKVIDGKSKVGKKLEDWFSSDGKEDRQAKQEGIEELKKIGQRSTRLPINNDPKTKLEKKIIQWLIASEQGERPLVVEERRGRLRHQVLVLTYSRAILFETNCFGRLKDISDKVWRQFIAVHLTEERFGSTLELRFFHYHDSVTYHNPFNERNALDENEFITWELTRLDKEKARQAYTYMKDKELYWQEKRRQEHLGQQRMGMGRPPGGAPSQNKGNYGKK